MTGHWASWAGLAFALGSTLLACGRTPLEVEPCVDEVCPCVFDEDCPSDEFVCIDNQCVLRADVRDCLERGASEEVCNGRDDDCDGLIDDGLVARACEVEQGALVCSGTELCEGERGWVCDAPAPSEEICDGIDNDCDGEADEGFVDEQGRYSQVAHCGGCGRDCTALIPGAVELECRDEGSCTALSCVDGRVPALDGSQCLLRQDGLCEACGAGSDCPLPGSACLDLGEGEFACGRACGPAGDPDGDLGPCPEGFDCISGQCRPSSGTCRCGPGSEGAVRACAVDVCGGFEVCEAGPSGFAWSSCDISANIETCDALDNDCDGRVDEDFRDDDGRYVSDQHCGACNSDCTTRFTVEDHALGACGFDDGRPECVIAACARETVEGVDFEFVDLNGLIDDGCECRRRVGVQVDAPDVFDAFPDLGTAFDDADCDGVDGDRERAVFVSASAPAGGDGSQGAPLRDLSAGLSALRQGQGDYVLVAEGVYDGGAQPWTLSGGDRLFGGYSTDFLRRDVVRFATALVAASEVAVRVSPSDDGRVLDLVGFRIQGVAWSGAAGPGGDGRNSVALLVEGADESLRVANNLIVAGQGEDGARGSSGFDGGNGRSGRAGIDQSQQFAPCTNAFTTGGQGGLNASCAVANGRDGGDAGCPSFDFGTNPVRGGQAEFQSPVGGDGLGGFHWSYDDISGPGCNHITESGFPSDFQSNNGQDGADGSDGGRGSDGEGCRGLFSAVEVGTRLLAPTRGSSGRSGDAGGGGGGGGAGGGTAAFPAGGCPRFDLGSTGGGGGAGGCGGEPGGAGGPGGLAVSLALRTPSTLGGVFGNRLLRGVGGAGGSGGRGGEGGVGGLGGSGGLPTSFAGSTGGLGGDGGNGGPGGTGGGGCGGSSIGRLIFGDASLPPTALPPVNAGAELAGRGGSADAPEGEGQDGEDFELLRLASCQSDDDCVGGCSQGFCLP
ncbi:MAG: MopE-related protein [Myxococcota bacterium]